MPTLLDQYRYFLKDTVRLTIDFSQTDQSRGVAPPPVEKPYAADGERIDLVPIGKWRGISTIDLDFRHTEPQQSPSVHR